MEESSNPNLSKIKIAAYFTACLVVLLLIFVSVKLAQAPIKRINQWEAQLTEENAASGSPIKVIKEARYDSIQRAIALRKALLSLTKKDSMVLVINLPDSSLNLFLNGVFIHNVKIEAYEIDPLLENLSLSLYLNQFSKPLSISSTNATIVKEPIIEKEAPKNPEELLAAVTTPDTVIFKPAYLKMSAQNGINFFIEQAEDSLKEDRAVRDAFKSVHQAQRRKAFINSLFGDDSYNYEPSLLLKVSKIELTAIYRALPKDTKVVVYYR
jgi:hypothetical protein